MTLTMPLPPADYWLDGEVAPAGREYRAKALTSLAARRRVPGTALVQVTGGDLGAAEAVVDALAFVGIIQRAEVLVHDHGATPGTIEVTVSVML